MKWVGFTLAILLLQIPLARSAEYEGKTIDGRTFPAQVYSYETGAAYEAQVQFNKDRATIEFPAGGAVHCQVTALCHYRFCPN